MSEYEDRNQWDLSAWPEMYDKLKELQVMIFTSPPGLELNFMVFTISSLAAGCRHCQAHASYGLERVGVPLEKIQAIWNFQSDSMFSDRERVALEFGLAAGSSPNAVGPEHHAAIRAHFSDEEARGLIATAALGGFMNRYNDSLATVTDTEAAEWAMTNLGPLGWDIGRHVGADHERRPNISQP